MTDLRAERWRQIDDLFGEVSRLGPADRPVFLDRACGGDTGLRREIERLLRDDEDAAGFLEQSALQELAEAVAGDVTSIVGHTIAGYRIEALLGSGGMGDVYRACDLKLEREVALKVLDRAGLDDPGETRRFEEEARSASGLNHPSIVTIYSVGEARGVAYIAMELVHGRTLRDVMTGKPIPIETTLDIAVQLADALAAAHTSGIVHRDLKPENVMVTPDGLVKVLDFGIARRRESAELADDGLDGLGGLIVGTAGYMSPEQAAGRRLDHRTDQFSFGTILCELVCGRRPFARATRTETIAAIMSDEPAPLSPLKGPLKGNDRRAADVIEVIARCLAKDPAGRYDNTRDLAVRLRAIRTDWLRHGDGVLSRRRALLLVAATAAAGIAGAAAWRFWPRGAAVRRLAVLPFANPAGDPDTEYLCDGVAGSLIRRLSLVPGLEVKALGAVLHFKKTETDLREIGRQLNADAVLTGSLTRRGGRLIVSAELIDVEHATRLWGDQFDRPQADVLAVHDEIAAAIVREGIGAAADKDGEQRFTRALTTNAEAYELYLRAVHHLRLQQEKDYLTARELLRRATAHDGSFALAHVTLASTFSVMAIDGYEAPHAVFPQSMASVTRALEVDPDLPDAHAEASSAAFYYRWDWAAADREWEIALGSHRGEVQAELLTSRALQKWALGRHDEALQFARAARQADPLSAVCVVREADLLAKQGQLEAAAALYDKVVGSTPNDPRAYFGLADVRRAQGRFDDAIDARRRAHEAAGDDSLMETTLSGEAGYARLERDDTELQLVGLGARQATGAYVSPLDYARVYAQLGDAGRAFDRLAAAFEHRAAGLVFLRVDPAWVRLRDDRRFHDAVRRVRFPAS